MRYVYKAIGYATGLAFVVGVTLYDAFCFMTVWNWTAPRLFGLPELTVSQSIMVGLVLMFHNGFTHRKTEGDEQVEVLVYHLMRPALFVLIAWIAKGYLP